MAFPPPSPAALQTLASQAAADLGLPLAPDSAVKLACWLQLLYAWNQRIDLTAARSPEELVDLCVADAAMLAQHAPAGATVVDIGSGAGAPGLPLAILRPDLRLTLVEPAAKRVAFLRTVVGSLQLDVTIMRERVERIVPPEPRWQLAVSRATLEPAAWLDTAVDLIASAATVAVLLARQAAPANPAMELAQTVDYVWPHTGVARRLCLYRRAAGPA